MPPFKLFQIWSNHFSEAADCQLNLSPDNGADAADHVFSPVWVDSLAAEEDSSVSGFNIYNSFSQNPITKVTELKTGERHPEMSHS